MTCYFRHLRDLFEKAGITPAKENKKEIDKAIHKLVNVEYKNCSSTWKEVKRMMAEDEKLLISKLKQAWSHHTT
ncbi:MAG: hypothetical protein PVF96_05965 [Candidatus Bathyarchaeota archaeon]